MNRSWLTILFAVAALYDGVLGFAFLAAPGAIYARCDVPPPNHWAYVQFPAALLIVFAIMFGAIAREPRANRNLIPYGVLLKVAYCAVAFGWWIVSGIPSMWKPFAILDIAWAALFLWAYAGLSGSGASARSFRV